MGHQADYVFTINPKSRVTPRLHLLVYSGEIEALQDFLYELFGWQFAERIRVYMRGFVWVLDGSRVCFSYIEVISAVP